MDNGHRHPALETTKDGDAGSSSLECIACRNLFMKEQAPFMFLASSMNGAIHPSLSGDLLLISLCSSPNDPHYISSQ
jgi:hypothetical protein